MDEFTQYTAGLMEFWHRAIYNVISGLKNFPTKK
jgi:hypothetical protein